MTEYQRKKLISLLGSSRAEKYFERLEEFKKAHPKAKFCEKCFILECVIKDEVQVFGPMCFADKSADELNEYFSHFNRDL